MIIKILIALNLLTSIVFADFGGIQMAKPRISSENGNYQIVITPFQGFPKAPGSCVAQMFKKEGNKNVLIWSRALINNYSPCELLVTNKGHLVTLDDSDGLGLHPVVFYNSIGKLEYIARLSDFPELKQNKKIPNTESGCRWRESSTYFLSNIASCLVIVAPDEDPVFLSIPSGLRISKSSSKHYKVDWDKLQAEVKLRVELSETK